MEPQMDVDERRWEGRERRAVGLARDTQKAWSPEVTTPRTAFEMLSG